MSPIVLYTKMCIRDRYTPAGPDLGVLPPLGTIVSAPPPQQVTCIYSILLER